MNKVTVLTIFPEIFESFLNTSLVKKAIEKGLFEFQIIQIRDFASPPHFQVDDAPFGGGAGMVMKPEPLVKAIEHAKQLCPKAPVILLSPSGTVFTQEHAENFSKNSELIFVCGRYEGVDQRVIDLMVDEEISIGDFVLMGGEIPAMAVIEATIRLVSDVIGNQDSLSHESFTKNENGERLLEAPHYTRPAEFRELKVPEVLVSGNHEKVKMWRQTQSEEVTKKRRADLLKGK